MNWPAAAASEAIKPAVIQVERDGQTVMATDWDRSWAQLPLAFQAGMDKLFNAWVRSVVGSPTMELTGGALTRLQALLPAGHIAVIHLTITDEPPYAQAG